MSIPNGLIAPFDDQPGVWLRCAFHVHITESDGWLTPTVQRRYHAWFGYDVLSITDHDTYTPEPPGEDELLVVGGTELSLTAPKSGGPLHLLGIGIERQPDVDRDATLTGAVFSWVPGVRYARIVATDDRGRRAWSNPIWAP